jgi:hypothetical protein
VLFSCAGKKPEEKKNGAQAGAATRDPVGARRAALSVLGSAVYAQCTEGIVPCVTRLWPSLSPPRRGHGPRAACPHQRPGSSCVGRTRSRVGFRMGFLVLPLAVCPIYGFRFFIRHRRSVRVCLYGQWVFPSSV